MKVSDKLRQAIIECEHSRYRIAKMTGISQATLSRFMSGERGLTLSVFDQLAELLGLELVARVKAGTSGKAKSDKKGRK